MFFYTTVCKVIVLFWGEISCWALYDQQKLSKCTVSHQSIRAGPSCTCSISVFYFDVLLNQSHLAREKRSTCRPLEFTTESPGDTELLKQKHYFAFILHFNFPIEKDLVWGTLLSKLKTHSVDFCIFTVNRAFSCRRSLHACRKKCTNTVTE